MRPTGRVASRLLRLAAAGLAVFALALTACSPTFAQSPPTPASVQSEIDPGTMREDEQAAVASVDAYWKRHFQEFFGRPYQSPRVAGGYVGENGPSCAGEPAVPFNAFYCLPEDFIAWDENLMSAGYQQIGDAWVYLIIAHEWGACDPGQARSGPGVGQGRAAGRLPGRGDPAGRRQRRSDHHRARGHRGDRRDTAGRRR